MFTYNYRIRDKHKKAITAWAIFSDTNKKFHPKEFSESFLGTELTYKFNTYKIIDQDEAFLRQSDNPFAIIILTVLLALKKNTIEDVKMIDLKIDLIRHLIEKKIKKEKIVALMNFLKQYVRFNPEHSIIFQEKLLQITGKTYSMGIEQFIIEEAKKEGEKKGERKGERKGMQEKELEVTKNLLLNTDFDNEKIALLVGVTVKFVQQVRKKLQ